MSKAALVQALAKARNELRRLLDEYAARYGDTAQPGGIPERRMLEQIEQKKAEVKALSGQSGQANTQLGDSLPRARGAETLEQMMGRYQQHFGTPYDPKNLSSIPERGISPRMADQVQESRIQALRTQLEAERRRREAQALSPINSEDIR